MGWMGIVVTTVLALLLVARPHLWPYVLVAIAPGVALALSAPGAPSDTAPTIIGGSRFSRLARSSAFPSLV